MAAVTLAEDDIQTILKKRLGPQNFELLTWRIKPLNEDGKLGYCGEHSLLDVTVRLEDHDETITFFIKTNPDNPVQRERIEAGSQNLKEVTFFTKISDRFLSILSRAPPIAVGSNLSIIPRCYKATDGLIILENLHDSGCRVIKTDSSSLLEFLIVSVRAVARFHAASIVLEEELGRGILEEFPEMDFEPFLDAAPDHPQASWHAASIRAASALVSLLAKYKDKPEIVKKTQEALPGLVKDLMGKMRAWPGEKNVLTHGDLWLNNVLCRLDAAGKPIEAVLVDFQLVRYAPPATDIVTFLMFSADKNFRDNHSETVYREYYQELSQTLLHLGLQPEKVFPWDDLHRTLKEMQKHALVLMAIEYPLVLAPSEFTESVLADSEKYRQHFLVDRTDSSIKLFQENEIFRARFTEIMEELIDNYIEAS